MHIRTFEHSDLERLLELTVETFRPFYEDAFRPLVGEVVFARQHGSWREDYRTLLADLHDPRRHKHVAVAEIGGEPAGYVGWYIEPAREYGCVEILAVAHHRRRGGLGRALCEHAFDHMRGHGAIYVEIGTGGDRSHKPARALYESLGCVKLPTAVYFREL
jgi:GNAT superfamily N-acetyltransferase